MPGPKPKLAVTTPVTANFPSEISSMSATKSVASPLSAMSYPAVPRSAGVFDNDTARTPISPPTAYSDFLRFMSLNSPMVTGKSTAFTFSPTSAPSSTPSSGATTPNSAPSTAASECSCKDTDVCSHNIKQEPQEEQTTTQEKEKSRKRRHPDPLPPPPPTSTKSAPLVPPSPFERPLLTAPATGVLPCFPSLHIPPSPALCLESPLTGTTAASATKSPYSSRSIKSPFDWEAALKARRFEGCTKPNTAPVPTSTTPTTTGKSSKTTVRHIREVVTRTVTYTPKNTPKMAPAPKGKRRKVE
ncbi:hypothetical protein MKZ38_002518 [Zalerion maritima]|uniref:Uncharacterized protein n=1 Tax=Zalerion maritima TaxID=339359 RepID=A0AAD5WSD3_9PEZI|nr:hypothetical protein MKZ38_002518 [Zalerion maritima]